jgi:4-amino-4-deoxy-L-arabinose transferase-like glycosyltransferase
MKKILVNKEAKKLGWLLLLVGIFTITRLVGLTKLPVFADEAIYIRWAQLAVSETDKYLFLPMLDGKPPLHAWSIVPFLQIFSDPLTAGRMLSVVAGLLTLFVVDKLVLVLGGKKQERLIAYGLVLVLPFWHFHQRMALAESLLVMFLAVAMYGGLTYLISRKKAYLIWLTLGVGGALWVKTSAFFFVPMLTLLPVLTETKKRWKEIYLNDTTIKLAWAGLAGVLIFLLLKFSPLFPQLFSRSLDYTFTSQELIAGEWKFILVKSLPRTLTWLVRYFSPLVLIVFLSKSRKEAILVLMAILYALPILAYGRVVSPRYFFPMVLPMTLAMTFVLSRLLKNGVAKNWVKLALGFALIYSSYFMYFGIVNPTMVPFAQVDKVQYLTEWSSGYGIPEVRDFIKEKIKTEKVSVKTEGTFGTLPDGLIMYFDKSENIGNLKMSGIEGARYRETIGELTKIAKEREAYFVINEHRLNVDPLPDNVKLLASYPRPLGGPSLLLLQVLPEE